MKNQTLMVKILFIWKKIHTLESILTMAIVPSLLDNAYFQSVFAMFLYPLYKQYYFNYYYYDPGSIT